MLFYEKDLPDVNCMWSNVTNKCYFKAVPEGEILEPVRAPSPPVTLDEVIQTLSTAGE